MTGNPHQGDEDHDGRGDAAGAHDLVLRGLGLPLVIEVHGEQRRAGVEDAGQRAHQGGQQAGHDDPPQPRRQHVLDHQRERGLGLMRDGGAVRATMTSSPGTLPLLARAKAIRPGTMKR